MESRRESRHASLVRKRPRRKQLPHIEKVPRSPYKAQPMLEATRTRARPLGPPPWPPRPSPAIPSPERPAPGSRTPRPAPPRSDPRRPAAPPRPGRQRRPQTQIPPSPLFLGRARPAAPSPARLADEQLLSPLNQLPALRPRAVRRRLSKKEAATRPVAPRTTRVKPWVPSRNRKR
jgi:hypothetical protein